MFNTICEFNSTTLIIIRLLSYQVIHTRSIISIKTRNKIVGKIITLCNLCSEYATSKFTISCIY